jgi:hypothetical protein
MKNSLDLWKDLTSLGLNSKEAEVKYYLGLGDDDWT